MVYVDLYKLVFSLSAAMGIPLYGGPMLNYKGPNYPLASEAVVKRNVRTIMQNGVTDMISFKTSAEHFEKPIWYEAV